MANLSLNLTYHHHCFLIVSLSYLLLKFSYIQYQFCRQFRQRGAVLLFIMSSKMIRINQSKPFTISAHAFDCKVTLCIRWWHTHCCIILFICQGPQETPRIIMVSASTFFFYQLLEHSLRLIAIKLGILFCHGLFQPMNNPFQRMQNSKIIVSYYCI